MCEFFSFTTKGDGIPKYFNAKLRKLINKGKLNYNPDSHTSINDYHGIKGIAEDKTNKYEYILIYRKFVIDQINTTDDSVQCEKWVNKFIKTKKFTNILSTISSLDLSGCDLKGITLPTSVGGSLDLSGCDLKGITLPTSVGGYLDLRGCDLKGITFPTSVGGYLDLRGCDLKGITLPTSVGGSLYLRGCDLKGIGIKLIRSKYRVLL